MKPKANPLFRFALLAAAAVAVLCAPAAQATDYSYGSVTDNFTITASDQARVQGAGTTASGTLSADNGAVYDRGSDQDATYMHFNLASLSGMTINGNVNLNLTVWNNWGGAINNGIIGTAASAWTTTSATPGITTFTPVAVPNQTYDNGATATWTIGNSTFTGILGDLANFNGLGITAGDGSNAHFSAPATLTGSYTGGAIRVTGGTDWSAAAWTEGTKTLAISSGDVSGGDVFLASTTKLDVTGSATLGSGNFAGNFNNSGTLAFGSSANQILSGAISGSGSLEKSGTGTLTLNGSISYKGGTTVNGGTLELPNADWHTGNPWNADGATGAIIVGSGATLSTSSGVTGIKNGLTLNGGTVSSRGLGYDGSWGNLFLLSNITAGGTVTSTITSQINLSGNRTITVSEKNGTLNVIGKINAWNSGGAGITKSGTGTLVLSGANGYTGVTEIEKGTLVAANNSALGESGWSGANMTWVRDGATLALQDGVSLADHMHVFGAGVDGLGAIRSLSGSNALTMTYNNSGSGPGFSIDSNTTVGVDADTLTLTGFYESGGSFGITKVGNGTLKLTQASTYTGSTTVSAGTVVLAHELALQNSTLLSAVTFDATVTSNAFTLGGLSGSANLSLLNNDLTPAAVALRVGNNNASTTYSGILSGTGSGLVKIGSGTLTLTGNNSYSGATSIQGGTLEFNAGTSTIGNITNSGANLTFSGGSVVTSGNITNSFGNITFSGSSVVTSGTLHFQGANPNPQLTISGNADVTLTGGITHQPSVGGDPYHAANYNFLGGTLHTPSISGPSISWNQAAASMHFDGTRIVATADNGNFITTTGWDHTNTINLRSTNGAIFDTAGFNIGIQVVMQDESGHNGKLTKLGAGTLTLSGNNTYTGATDVQNGTLQLTGALSSSTALSLGNGSNSGKFILGGTSAAVNQTVAGLTTTGSGVANAVVGGNSSVSTLAVNLVSGTNTFAGTLGGASANENNLALTKSGAGTLTLSGSNTYSGGTRIVDGALVVGNDNALGTGLMTLDGGNLASNDDLRSIMNPIIVTGTVGNQVTGGSIAFSGTAGGAGTLNVNLSGTSAKVTVNPTVADSFGDATTTIKVTQGTLLLGGSNVIGNNTAIDLAGGTFNTGGKDETVGALTLSGSSTIDFSNNTATSTLSFTTGTNDGSYLLSVYNWAGGPSGTTHLNFNPGLTSGFLNNVQFYSGAGSGGGWSQGALQLGSGELVPIPEPATIVGALAFVGLVALRERRRLRGLWGGFFHGQKQI